MLVMSHGFSPRTRDLALRRLSRLRRTALAATVGLTIAFTAVAARAFPGHARGAQRVRPAGPATGTTAGTRQTVRRHHRHHSTAASSSQSSSAPSSSSSSSSAPAPAPAPAPTVQPPPQAPAPTTQAPVVTSGGS